ncbi:hypothetical protein [Nakamurella lactea]|uniref:hypothetical protein n=1 Tax=Nakamurella lactea TaxID=459515 RepID=UPI0012B65C36|nr:hypothetical protein [Nakamurella lactea]
MVAAAVIVIFCPSGWLAATTSVGAAATPGDPVCYHASKTYYIDSRGQQVVKNDSTTATVYSFEELGGGELIVPPAGFSFERASDEQLAAWGYPPRGDGSEADWTTTEGALHAQSYDVDPTLCEYPDRYASYNASPIWTGVEPHVSANDFRRVYGSSRIPTFQNSTCSGTTAVAFWVGIGNPNGLIQNGWVTDDGSPQGMFPFFEFVSGSIGVPLTRKPGVGQAGDLVKSDTYFNKGTSPHQVQFNWTDLTTGTVLTPYVVKQVRGDDQQIHNVDDYYDGSQVELVDERLGSTPVRSFSVAGWANMYAARAGQSAATVGSFAYNTSYVTGGSGTILGLSGGVLTSSTQMNIKWVRCS